MENQPDRYRRLEDPDQRAFVRSEINRFLVDATKAGCESIGCTGVSFVLMGMAYWSEEIVELDPALAARYLRQLALIYDPKSNHQKRTRAELKRRDLFKQICAIAGEAP